MNDNPCPVPSCSGQLYSKHTESLGWLLGCDGPESHGDATVRLALHRELEHAPDDSELMMRLDPIEFIRSQVRRSTERRGGGVTSPRESMLVRPPSYPTGLGGVANGRLLRYLGMTVLSGKASSGKTWSALRASLDAAADGWDVHYLAAEHCAVVNERRKMLVGDEIPPRWQLQVIEDGSTVRDISSYIAEHITSERTLVVVDSFSTMLRMLDPGVGETWGLQRELERFLFNLRDLTAGCVAPLVVSEANAAGETKGRSFDHLADLSVNFRADEDEPEIKHVRVAKSAWERMGDAGRYRPVPHQGGLVRLPDPSESVAEQRGYEGHDRALDAAEGRF